MAQATNHANADLAILQQGNKALYGGASAPHLALEVDFRDERSNAAGGGNTKAVAFFDNFLGAAIDSRWVATLSTGATAAVNSQTGGAIRISTDTDDDDRANFALGLHWTVSNGWTVCEAKVRNVTAITLRGVEIGLSDATSETAGLAFSSIGGSPTAIADNAAVFAINSDDSIASWACATVKAAGTPSITASGVAPVAAVYQEFRVAIDALGNCYFWINDVLVATKLLAIATTAILTPWIALKSLSGAIKIIDVDYINVYGNVA